ncbi:5987_t:CDS:2, partial [Funneliformis geosporum]
SSHDDFHFYPQKESQQIPSLSYYGSTGEKKESALVHNSAVQIEQFYSNKVAEIRKSVPLAYYLYGGVKSEGDVLIRKKLRLNDNCDYETSAEINGVFERNSTANQSIRREIVDTINQQKNKFKVEKVVILNEEINDYEEEDFDNKDGRLIFDSENMFKVKDLTEAEKQAIGYNKYKSEAGLQNNSSISNSKNDNKLDTGGILAIIGVVSVISVVGVLLVRKKLNNKIFNLNSSSDNSSSFDGS